MNVNIFNIAHQLSLERAQYEATTILFSQKNRKNVENEREKERLLQNLLNSFVTVKKDLMYFSKKMCFQV